MRHRRTRARKRPLPNWKISHASPSLGAFGPYVYDHVSGTLREKAKCVKQRGGYVSADYKDGTRDLPETRQV